MAASVGPTMAIGHVLARVWLLAAVLGLALAAPSVLEAQADVDGQVRAIAAQLRCPVCQNLSVADSPSELAREMRNLIREQLQAGETGEEVKAYFVTKYGDWILLAPRPRGLSLLVWVGPFVGVVFGLAVVGLAVRRWARRPAVPEPVRAEPALIERVQREAFEETDLEAVAEDLSPVELERNRLYVALRELDFDYRCGKLSEADFVAIREQYEARAAAVLGALEQARAAMPSSPDTAAGGSPAPDTASAVRISRLHRWKLAATAGFVLVFGLTLGYFLAASLRPRMGEQDTLTGDFLTGTGPGGIMPGSRGPGRDVATLLASGRTAFQRQDWSAAIDSFKQVLALDADNSETHTFLGLILLHAGHADDALLAVEHVLDKDSRYPFALWVKGLVLFEGKQDYARAIEAWERLMAQPLSETDADNVARAIVEARQRLAAQPAAPRRSAERSTIAGTVVLAPALRAQIAPSAVLFIIARRGDGPPVAVKRIPNPAFPVTFSLGPEDRMLRDRPFEGELMLVARLKRDGAAGPPAPGDLEGRLDRAVQVGQHGVRIKLDKAY